MTANADAVQPILTSTLTCPACGERHEETMPEDACIYFFACRGCGLVLNPKAGECCVFCSYGSVRCPPMQTERAGDGPAGDCCRC